MKKIKIWWQSLARKQQNQLLILLMAVALGLYGLYFIGLNKEIKKAESMISRTKHRMELRFKNIEAPRQNPQVLKKNLDQLTTTLLAQEEKLVALEATLIPLDSMAHVQKMRLEVSRLAERSGMVIRKMEGKNSRRSKNKMDTLSEEYMRSQTNNRYHRPLVKVTAVVDFRGLLTFLDGLRQFDYNVSPVNLKVRAMVPEQLDASTALDYRQLLRIELLLAL